MAPLERFTIKFTANVKFKVTLVQNRRWTDKTTVQTNSYGWNWRKNIKFFVNVMNSKLVNVITVKANLVTWYELKFDVCRKRDSKSLHWDTGKSLKRYLWLCSFSTKSLKIDLLLWESCVYQLSLLGWMMGCSGNWMSPVCGVLTRPRPCGIPVKKPGPFKPGRYAHGNSQKWFDPNRGFN